MYIHAYIQTYHKTVCSLFGCTVEIFAILFLFNMKDEGLSYRLLVMNDSSLGTSFVSLLNEFKVFLFHFFFTLFYGSIPSKITFLNSLFNGKNVYYFLKNDNKIQIEILSRITLLSYQNRLAQTLL